MTSSDPSVIARAADLGINHFDTARSYQNGHNERLVGPAGRIAGDEHGGSEAFLLGERGEMW